MVSPSLSDYQSGATNCSGKGTEDSSIYLGSITLNDPNDYTNHQASNANHLGQFENTSKYIIKNLDPGTCALASGSASMGDGANRCSFAIQDGDKNSDHYGVAWDITQADCFIKGGNYSNNKCWFRYTADKMPSINKSTSTISTSNKYKKYFDQVQGRFTLFQNALAKMKTTVANNLCWLGGGKLIDKKYPLTCQNYKYDGINGDWIIDYPEATEILITPYN